MTKPGLKARLAAVALMAAGLWAPGAMAAQGETSGPAAGNNTVPSAATQKQVSKETGTAAGAPGVEGKQGAESGAAPQTPASKSQKNSQQ